MNPKSSFLFLLLGLWTSIAQALPMTASVTILAVSPFGELLRPVKVTTFAADRGRGHDYSSQFSGVRAEQIPYGAYFAQVRAGDRVIAAFVQVSRDDALIVLSGPKEIVERGSGLPGVSGKVVGGGGMTPIWIRMVKVFSEDVCCTIVPLSADGTFSLGGLDASDYVLLVLSDGRVLFEGRVRIDTPSALIEVDLAKGRATVQRR